MINHSPRYIFELILVIFLLSFLTLSILINKDVNFVIPVLSVFAVAAARLLPGVSVIIHSINILNYFYKSVLIVHEDLKKYGNTKKKFFTLNTSKNEKNLIFKDLKIRNISFKYPNLKKKLLIMYL